MLLICSSLVTSLPFLLYSLAINSGYSASYKILGLCPINSYSHFNMFEKLMKGLANRGHQVDVVSHFPQEKHHKNYKDLSIRGSTRDLKNNVAYEEITRFSNVLMVKTLIERLGNVGCELFGLPIMQRVISKTLSKDSYDLIIIEIHSSPCYFALGRHFNVPMIGFITGSLYEWINDPLGNPDNPAFIPATSLGYEQYMNFLQRLLNTVTTFLVKVLFSYYSSIQNNYVEKYFGPGYPDVYELQKNVSLVLVNSHYSLTGIRPLTNAVIEVGGMHIQDNEEKLPQVIQEWLDKSENGCIYVSFGSMVKIETFPKKTMEAFYATFRSIAPVRVLIKTAKEQYLPPGLPKNVKTYAWLPQLKVLKHRNIKAFVTQGGLLSILESIHCGVPLIGLPIFLDQFSNINHMVHRKVAIALNCATVTEKEFTNATNEILHNDLYKKNAERLQKLYLDRPATPLETAIFWIEYIGRNGNVLRSPALDLEWWQVKLLDVYGALLLILFISFYLAYLVTRKCVRYLLYLRENVGNLNLKKNILKRHRKKAE